MTKKKIQPKSKRPRSEVRVVVPSMAELITLAHRLEVAVPCGRLVFAYASDTDVWSWPSTGSITRRIVWGYASTLVDAFYDAASYYSEHGLKQPSMKVWTARNAEAAVFRNAALARVTAASMKASKKKKPVKKPKGAR